MNTRIWGFFLPARRAKRLAICESLDRNTGSVGRVQVYSIAPPLLDSVEADGAIVRVLKSEEDENNTESITRIQSSG